MTTAIRTTPRSKAKANTSDYWRVYHTADVLTKADAIRKAYTIPSTGVAIHIDAYEQTDPKAPVFIFNHGGGGYSGLLVPMALEMHSRGYTVLLPDQRGQGFSGGNRSDFTIGEFVQNIVDVAHWARKKYSGDLFLGGGSMGSGLAYQAAAAGAPVRAVVCHNLYDFGDPTNGLALSVFAPLARIPLVPALTAHATRFLGALLPTLRLPYKILGKFHQMVDERCTDFYPKYRRDPIPIKRISLRYLASLFNTAPAIPLEQNRLPILVINPTRDKMVNSAVTYRNSQRLGGEKAYVEVDYGHWAMGETFDEEWATIVSDFLRTYKTSR